MVTESSLPKQLINSKTDLSDLLNPCLILRWPSEGMPITSRKLQSAPISRKQKCLVRVYWASQPTPWPRNHKDAKHILSFKLPCFHSSHSPTAARYLPYGRTFGFVLISPTPFTHGVRNQSVLLDLSLPPCMPVQSGIWWNESYLQTYGHLNYRPKSKTSSAHGYFLYPQLSLPPHNTAISINPLIFSTFPLLPYLPCTCPSGFSVYNPKKMTTIAAWSLLLIAPSPTSTSLARPSARPRLLPLPVLTGATFFEAECSDDGLYYLGLQINDPKDSCSICLTDHLTPTSSQYVTKSHLSALGQRPLNQERSKGETKICKTLFANKNDFPYNSQITVNLASYTITFSSCNGSSGKISLPLLDAGSILRKIKYIRVSLLPSNFCFIVLAEE